MRIVKIQPIAVSIPMTKPVKMSGLRYELGPWVRASVVPYGDGAVLVVSTRP